MSLSLSIQLDHPAVNAMKAYMTRTLPDVKSSHRCEGLARGLGYRTYAALIAAPASETAQADGQAFAEYLAAQGFECPPSQLYRTAAFAALAQVAEQEPRLTAWGIGIGEFQREQNGQWETTGAYNRRRGEARRELIADGAIPRFLLSLALLQRIPPTATIRSGNRQLQAEAYRGKLLRSISRR